MAVVENQVNALELEKVLRKVESAFEDDEFFFANVRKRPVEVISNRQMRVPLEIRPGGSFGYWNPDGGDLGRGGGPTWDKAVVSAVFVKEAIEYTKLTEYSTDTDGKSVVNAVRRMTARATDEIRRQIDSQLMTDGSGTIGTVTSDTPAGGNNVLSLNTDGFGARLMRFGQTVSVFDSTYTTNKGSAKIVNWDVVGKSVSLNPQIGAGLAAGDLIVTDGITTPLSLPGLYGVSYHHNNSSTGSWLGYSRSSTPEIRSNRVNAGGAAFSLPLPRLLMNYIGNRVGRDNEITVRAWTHPAQFQAYEQIGQLITNIRADTGSTGDKGLNLYFNDRMNFAGAPGVKHYNWNPSRIDFVADEIWGRGEILPIGFYKADGRSIFEIRGVSGGVAAAEIFYMVTGFQTFLTNPAASAYIDNLAVPSGY